MTTLRPLSILLPLALACLLLKLGCAGANLNRGAELSRLRTAIESQVSSPEQSAELSRTVESVLQTESLTELTRDEVQDAIGRGDPCSRHPICAEQGFKGDDWYYAVGQAGEGHAGALPELIVGFDRTGRVSRTWNLRIED